MANRNARQRYMGQMSPARGQFTDDPYYSQPGMPGYNGTGDAMSSAGNAEGDAGGMMGRLGGALGAVGSIASAAGPILDVAGKVYGAYEKSEDAQLARRDREKADLDWGTKRRQMLLELKEQERKQNWKRSFARAAMGGAQNA